MSRHGDTDTGQISDIVLGRQKYFRWVVVSGGWRTGQFLTELKVELWRSGQLELLLDPAEENSELEALASGW